MKGYGLGGKKVWSEKISAVFTTQDRVNYYQVLKEGFLLSAFHLEVGFCFHILSWIGFVLPEERRYELFLRMCGTQSNTDRRSTLSVGTVVGV